MALGYWGGCHVNSIEVGDFSVTFMFWTLLGAINEKYHFLTASLSE